MIQISRTQYVKHQSHSTTQISNVIFTNTDSAQPKVTRFITARWSPRSLNGFSVVVRIIIITTTLPIKIIIITMVSVLARLLEVVEEVVVQSFQKIITI